VKSSFRYSLVPILLCELDLANPNLLLTCQFFHDFYAKSSSRCSLLHILPNSSSKSAPYMAVFCQFFCEIELSLQSCALFADNFCRSRPATAETETLHRRPRKPLYPEKHRVLRPEIFSSLNSRVPDLSHFPTNYMMMRLTWWCGCHGENLAMTTARNSEVF